MICRSTDNRRTTYSIRRHKDGAFGTPLWCARANATVSSYTLKTRSPQLTGLHRAMIAAPRWLHADAFDELERAPQGLRVQRHGVRDLLSVRTALAPEEGHGCWELTRVGTDLLVIVSDFTFHNPRIDCLPSDGLIQFSFMLSGESSYRVSRPRPEGFNERALHVWRPNESLQTHCLRFPRSRQRRVTLSVRPEFLVEDLLPVGGEVSSPLHSVALSPAGASNACQLPLTTEMIATLTSLLDNRYDGTLQQTYVEALALELLCLAVANVCSRYDQPDEKYSMHDLRALGAARCIVMEQFTSGLTPHQLARAEVCEPARFNNGFKIVYGETLTDFCLRCRMHHALTLLRDHHWSATQVAQACGYSTTSSFATTFRRHFGVGLRDVEREETP
jgi:AraC-like DNA-binding protein